MDHHWVACNGIPTIDSQKSCQPLSPAGFLSTLGEPPMSVICLCNTLFGISLHTDSNLYILPLAWQWHDATQISLKSPAAVGNCWPISLGILGFTGLLSTLIIGTAVLIVILFHLLNANQPWQRTVSRLNLIIDLCSLKRETLNEWVCNENTDFYQCNALHLALFHCRALTNGFFFTSNTRQRFFFFCYTVELFSKVLHLCLLPPRCINWWPITAGRR